MTILEIIFWIAALTVVYVYAGYPLVLAGLASLRKREVPQADSLPTVTMIVSAYNERVVIESKIRNALSLDYPTDLLTVMVISDCSDDGTDDVVRSFDTQGVILVRSSERLGKTAGLNLGIGRATSDILIFSDANAMYQPDAVRLLVRHFSNPRVGYVVGNARYVESGADSASANSEGLYWKLETWLKQRESDFGSVVGGDGAIYAIRRQLYSPLRPTDINDFLNPLQIIVRGCRGVYEPAAVCFEEAGDTFEKEFRRKVRIVSRSFNALRRAPRVLLPWVQPAHWFSLISHKLLRWFAPVFLLLTLVTSLMLWTNPVYRAVAVLQVFFYALAIVGWLLQKRATPPRAFYIPYYFCLVNIASLIGIAKCFGGALSPTWQTIRQPAPAEDAVSLAKRRS